MSSRRLLCVVVLVTVASGAVRMPAHFGDNMVLQSNYESGVRAFLNGWATPGELVTVTAPTGPAVSKPHYYYATAAADGSWRVQLNPPGLHLNIGAASCNITVRGSAGGPAIVARDVYYGDVWLCAGGAAMAAPLAAPAGVADAPLPPNLRVFTVGGNSSAAGGGGGGWLSAANPKHAAALKSASRLCLLSAAQFLRAFPKPSTRKLGLIVAATARDGEVREWMPAGSAVACDGGAGDGEGDGDDDGTHYHSLVKPLVDTSLRAALLSIAAPLAGTTRHHACLFGSLINAWRDAGPNGDYAFAFAQQQPQLGAEANDANASAVALAQSASLPRAALGGTNASAVFASAPMVDTSGMAATADLGATAAGGGGDAAPIARRLALAVVHAAFAKQPASAFSGPRPTAAAWLSAPEAATSGALGRSSTHSFSLHFAAPAVLPGKLQLSGAAGCAGVDLRLCPGIEPDALLQCADADVTLDSDGVSLRAEVPAGPAAAVVAAAQQRGGSGARALAVLMSRPRPGQCLLSSTASNFSVAVSAVAIAPASLLQRPPTPSPTPLVTRLANASSFATPPLGWNAWNAFHCDVSERLVMAMADALAAAGLSERYRYLNLDDCWMVDRDADGNITPDPVRFPSGIKALVDYVRSKGLRFGIYQAPGATTPQGRPGLLGHEARDVATFCEWGVSYLKLDAKGSTRQGWEKVRAAIDECAQPMYLQVAFCKSVAACEGWMPSLANGWRTSADAQANWASVMGNVDATEPLWALAGPTGPIGGHWNDADLLEVGQAGALNAEESRGCDGRNQQWLAHANGSLTSWMDGSCLDVFARKNPVQAHYCVPDPSGGAGPPESEAWRIDPAPVAGVDVNVTVRWATVETEVWEKKLAAAVGRIRL
eukprot:g2350.t1